MKKLLLALLPIFLLVFIGCSQRSNDAQIRISTNPWVGFTPFMYAQEKGWLKKTRFRFLWSVDLADNVSLYERGLSDGFTATQYELFNFKNKEHLKPYFLIDRSNGADMVLSNLSVEEIKNSKGRVFAHLELVTVNQDLFKAFLERYGIGTDKFELHHTDQKNISIMKASDVPTLIVSYEPYAGNVQKNGFKKIASTKDLTNIRIIDAIFIDESRVQVSDVLKLKELFGLAVAKLKEDPKEFYESIKGYLEGQTFEEFKASLDGIEWLHDGAQKDSVEYLKKHGIAVDRLIL